MTPENVTKTMCLVAGKGGGSTRRHKSLILVGGSKGGVGKSLVTMSCVDWLTCAIGESVLVVDTDTANPDVYKMYASKDELKRELDPINLDNEDGWLDLLDDCNTHPEAHVLINTGARNLNGMLAYAAMALTSLAAELDRRVVLLWVVDDKRDCVEMLRTYLEQTPVEVHRASKLHVVCNEGKVPGLSFSFYEKSGTAKLVAKASGKTIVMPNLALRATALLYNERRTIRALAEPDAQNPVLFSVQMAMSHWRHSVWQLLETLDLLDDDESGELAR